MKIPANWRTTLSGGLNALFSAIVTGTLTFPSDWHNVRQDVLFGLVVVGTFCGMKFATSAKDKMVTGGIVQQTEHGHVAPDVVQEASKSVKDTTLATSVLDKQEEKK